MSLLTLSQVCLAYGHVPLLDHVDFSLETRERVGLIGRNGTGKSSLLKIMAALEPADDGRVQRQQGLTLSYVAQEPALEASHTVFQAVAEGLAPLRDWIRRYESHAPGEDLDALQTFIEAHGGWHWEQRVQETLGTLGLPADTRVAELSGGQRKRVALAQALVARPDVLLLDEPTNHLDLDAILWLEDLLQAFPGSLMVITHDRAFLDAVATRIVELDRGRLRSYPGRFSAYQAAKARELHDEALAQAREDKLLAQEEAWIRQGVEARRTRSVSRIHRLERLRAQRAERREALGRVKLELDAGQRSGRLVAELEHVSKAFGPRVVVKDFSATILRGDKVGLVGPNGAGKTTLLKLILGELPPDSGQVRRGANLQVAYFDQMRDGLRLDATLADTISPGSEWIEIGTTRKHVMSYLGDFLFAPQRANAPVSTLSGGERNRLLLARLFARPANVLVLDEPTNDLDMDTLDLLEDLLGSYEGTVFLVSHDRRFLDHVVTSVIAWEGDTLGEGRWREYEGNVEDWLTQSARTRGAATRQAERGSAKASAAPASVAPAAAAAAPPSRRKLSHKEQRELEALPARIETLEAEQKQLGETLADSRIYKERPQEVATLQDRYAAIEAELMTLLERWEALSLAEK